MKLITLNTWGGRGGKEALLDFFRTHKDDVDFFCLQEVWSAPYEHMEGTKAGGTPIENKRAMTEGLQEISGVLEDHVPHFRPLFGDDYGILMCVSKKYEILEEGEEFVYMHKGYFSEKDFGDHARLVQYVTIQNGETPLTILNFHGLWTPKPEGRGKQDIPERLEQSERIVSLLERFDHPLVLAGDFNLLPDSESVGILERSGLRNLITEYKVSSTRTKFYTTADTLFADYIFTRGDVTVRDFKVLPDEVSDHAPLFLDFD
ncbi:endonuclease/exonuclease/phosphatase family protein [Candidatus Kaiserbacteria bacterium]|nr:endonuclease/exonuclease/phosphatase family protein [Candidatus Kaiserbacteria bacterium]